ncbi:MAG TPA: hypothetical protein VMX56_02250 [Anaerolineales bacterium]|nr:hypothetical protein [Anaerolineales bacterium]HUV60931.1 hypothetical protein [Thermoplasmata archaeon]
MAEMVVLLQHSFREVGQRGAKGKPVVGHHFIVGNRQYSTDFRRRASPPMLLLFLSFILILTAILGLTYLGPIGGSVVVVLVLGVILIMVLGGGRNLKRLVEKRP